jgi:hypothetical protein
MNVLTILKIMVVLLHRGLVTQRALYASMFRGIFMLKKNNRKRRRNTKVKIQRVLRNQNRPKNNTVESLKPAYNTARPKTSTLRPCINVVFYSLPLFIQVGGRKGSYVRCL